MALCITDPFVNGFSLFDLPDHFVNGEAIRQWASTTARMLQVIQYSKRYRPIREWTSIFAQVLLVTQCNIDYGLIREWESVFAKVCMYLYTLDSSYIDGFHYQRIFIFGVCFGIVDLYVLFR